MRRFLFCFLNLISVTALCQNIDSLESLLWKDRLAVHDRIVLLNQLARDISFVDPIKSVSYGQEALRLSQETNDDINKAYALRNLGSSYSNFGSLYLAMDNLRKAQDIFREINDSGGIASCYISLGHIYRKLKNRQKELANNLMAYEIFNRLGKPERIGVTAHNLGETYFYTGNYSKAFELTRTAIVINDSIGNLSVLSSCYKVMGKLYFQAGALDSAVIYYKKVLDISARLGDKSQKIATIESMIDLAAVYDKQGFHETELATIIKASDFVKQYKLSDYVENVYTQLIREYVVRSRNQDALNVIAELRSVEDTIRIRQLIDKEKLTAGFIQLFDTEKKNKQLEEENFLQTQRIQNRNIVVIIILISVLILLILLGGLFMSRKKLSQSNKTLLMQESVIREQNAKLEELNANKDKFFSIVSHDIKAPLNSLWSFSNIINDHLDELGNPDLLELSRQLNRQVESSAKMVDDLILWSKLQMKDFVTHTETLESTDMVRLICHLYRDIAADKEITLIEEINEPVYFRADKNHAAFIVRNFINNAIKYTAVGGRVTVKAQRTTDGKIRISVEDTGIGFDASLLHKIESSEPLKSKTGTSGETGTGLGLKLCYEFAHLNAASIEIDSKPAAGSVFAVIFPSA